MSKRQKSSQQYQDLPILKQRLEKEMPKKGEYIFDYQLEEAEKQKDKLSPEEFRLKYKINFQDLPISKVTLQQLHKRNFQKMTEIQRCTITHGLAGRDILGASKTGSGKTLSYLIPVLELLYRNQFTDWDGLGALIICPTRELATQVFEVLASISQTHNISVGLVIGGKNLKYEKQHIQRMNILVCTPGRLLQHMEETEGFESNNLKILVLDEADTMLEMGFRETLNAILEYIPAQRQTLLFSATLNKQVHELGRLSLKEPEYIFLHDKKSDKKDLTNLYEAPAKLQQYYMVIPLHEKLNTLYSFLRMHQKQKIIVFFSTCKQVRFAHETFKKIKTGLPHLELHGRQKHQKRMAIFFTFQEKKHACLFTTNLSSRGLDFPQVDWVVQVDCPEDEATYYHRIGRTARYKAEGKSLLFLTPLESKFADELKEKHQHIHKIQQNPSKKLSITSTLQAYCSESVELKYLAQKSLICYLKSINNATRKDIFDVNKIPVNEFAESLGLIQTPVIRFKKVEKIESDSEEIENEDSENEEEQIIKKKKVQNQDEDENQEEQEGKGKKSKVQKLREKIKQKKLEKQIALGNIESGEQNLNQNENNKKPANVKHLKLVARQNQDVLGKDFDKIRNHSNEEEQEEEFFTLKRKNVDQSLEQDDSNNPYKLSIRQQKKIKIDGHFGGKNKIIFDEEGNPKSYDEVKMEKYKQNEQLLDKQNINQSKIYASKIELHDEEDRINEIKRRKEKSIKKKILLKELKGDIQKGSALQATLEVSGDEYEE